MLVLCWYFIFLLFWLLIFLFLGYFFYYFPDSLFPSLLRFRLSSLSFFVCSTMQLSLFLCFCVISFPTLIMVFVRVEPFRFRISCFLVKLGHVHFLVFLHLSLHFKIAFNTYLCSDHPMIAAYGESVQDCYIFNDILFSTLAYVYYA